MDYATTPPAPPPDEEDAAVEPEAGASAAAADYDCDVPELIAKGQALVSEVCSGERKQ